MKSLFHVRDNHLATEFTLKQMRNGERATHKLIRPTYNQSNSELENICIKDSNPPRPRWTMKRLTCQLSRGRGPHIAEIAFTLHILWPWVWFLPLPRFFTEYYSLMLLGFFDSAAYCYGEKLENINRTLCSTRMWQSSAIKNLSMGFLLPLWRFNCKVPTKMNTIFCFLHYKRSLFIAPFSE